MMTAGRITRRIATASCLVAVAALPFLPAALAAGAAPALALALGVALALRPRPAAAAADPPPPARLPEPEVAEAVERSEGRREIDQALRACFRRLADGDLKARLPESAGDLATTVNAGLADMDAAVDELLALTDLLGQGDLSTPANGNYRGSLLLLRDAFNRTRAGLREIVEHALAAATDVAGRSGELAASAESARASGLAQREASAAVEAARTGLEASVRRVLESVDAVRHETAEARAQSRAGEAVRLRALASISRLSEDTDRIGSILQVIDAIAMQTNLLAVNASIEAARAGAAGRGFAVVSAEVQVLAQRSGQAAAEIRAIVQGSSKSVADCTREVQACSDLIVALVDRIGATETSADRIRAACDDQVAALSSAGREISALTGLAGEAYRLAEETAATGQSLETVAGELRAAMDRFRLEDDVMIAAATDRAREIGHLFEAAVERNEISRADLFSTDYRRIGTTEPPQFATPYVPLTDRVLPPLLESALKLHDGVVFCAAVTRDGFLPTHNAKFSLPPGPDVVRNTAQSRNRRFFRDRVGLAAGQSRAAHLLQAYRRDMGGGRFVTMKDVSAPILVFGQHWGGLRIGYRNPETAEAAEPRRALAG